MKSEGDSKSYQEIQPMLRYIAEVNVHRWVSSYTIRESMESAVLGGPACLKAVCVPIAQS